MTKVMAVIVSFISGMIKRVSPPILGREALRRSKLPPGKMMVCQNGILTSTDTKTGKVEVVSPEEMTSIGTDGVDMPVVHGQDEPPRCTECGSYDNLHQTKFGWMCETCIQDGADAQDKIQEEAESTSEW